MDTLDWLLDADPAIRWQAMRDLTDAPAAAVASRSGPAFRARGSAPKFSPARGRTARGTEPMLPIGCRRSSQCSCCARPAWTAPTGRRLGSRTPRGGLPVGRGVRWHTVLRGRGRAVYQRRHARARRLLRAAVQRLARRLVGEQLGDGGWNCEAPKSARSSFHTTICVLEGLLEYERAVGATPEIAAVRRRGERSLLERRPVPTTFHRRGRGSGVPGVRVPAALRVRRPPCARLFPRRWRPARRAHRRSGACRREQASAARWSMAARSHPQRGARLPVQRIGGRAESVEHVTCAACAAFVQARINRGGLIDSPSTATRALRAAFAA